MSNILMNRGLSLSEQVYKMEVVFETMRLQNVMLQMQKKSAHMVAVIDEFGGTAGIITMEDILEEIVGEIRDEFDQDEQSDIIQTGPNEYEINGRVLLIDLEEKFGFSFDRNATNVETIGGWVQYQTLNQSGRNEVFEHENQVWSVLEKDNLQIVRVKLKSRKLR